jgi:succinyl-CoA synthetase alpha subunit
MTVSSVETGNLNTILTKPGRVLMISGSGTDAKRLVNIELKRAGERQTKNIGIC